MAAPANQREDKELNTKSHPIVFKQIHELIYM